MFTTIFLVALGLAYLNTGRYLVQKEMEKPEIGNRKWWDQFAGMIMLPLWVFGQFSVFCTKKIIFALDKVLFAPALYLYGKRVKKARLKAAEDPVEPEDPKLLAEAAEAADRAAQGLPDLDPDPDPEPELELELEPDPEPEPNGSPIK
ncbi:MAG: hypothetical protein A2534_03175 [Candidatus Magasanikbacteria bacterium RIFOXYD2_FULL_39_9]|nr:MAG: hypothetical protein A2534_03175 [Candidatus Magasanikbacteria bacterium RIFOXYD2_FULL_39_9]